jgi:Concanavalin A-like lectin/glucanases superfamily
MKFLLLCLSALFCVTVFSGETVVLDMPLNEGQGMVVKSVDGKLTGTILSGTAGTPKWAGNEIIFPGGKKVGKIKIKKGGTLLFGKKFEVKFDLKILNANDGGYLLSSKAMSTKTGGFTVFYWGSGRKFFFNFSDGKKKYQFDIKLKKRLPKDKWTTIAVMYNGKKLTVAFDDTIMGTMELKNITLAPTRGPLCIGGYLFSGPASINCSIRNLKLIKLIL